MASPTSGVQDPFSYGVLLAVIQRVIEHQRLWDGIGPRYNEEDPGSLEWVADKALGIHHWVQKVQLVFGALGTEDIPPDVLRKAIPFVEIRSLGEIPPLDGWKKEELPRVISRIRSLTESPDRPVVTRGAMRRIISTGRFDDVPLSPSTGIVSPRIWTGEEGESAALEFSSPPRIVRKSAECMESP